MIFTFAFDNITHSFVVKGLFILSAKFTKKASDDISFTLPSFHSMVIRILFFHLNIMSFVLFATEVNPLSSISSHISFNHPSQLSHLYTITTFPQSIFFMFGIFSSACFNRFEKRVAI